MLKNLCWLVVITFILPSCAPNQSGRNVSYQKPPARLSAATNQETVIVEPDSSDIITVATVGDLMLNSMRYKEGSVYPFESVAETLKKADVAIANAEIPLTTYTVKTPLKTDKEIKEKRQYVLKANPKFASVLHQIGIDMVGLGNNHTMDWQKNGLIETMNNLSTAGVLFAGGGKNSADARKPAIYEVNGVRVALLSYLAFRSTYSLNACLPAGANSPGIAIIPCHDSPVTKEAAAILENDINTARKQADLVFVAFHWGTEKSQKPTDYQKSLGRKAIDLGANMVIGHHPHVLQPYERYKGGVILYSHGNFVSPSSRAVTAESLIFLTTWENGKLKKVDFKPVRITSGAPILLTGSAENSARKKFNELCEDFCR